MSVLSGRALQQQLSVIMEALTRAAVAEIVELVDGGYAALQLEISRSRQENQDLRKKLHLIESIVVRGGKAVEDEPKDAPAAGEAPRTETPQQHREGDGGEAAAAAGGDRGAAGAMREEFPDVVLIKDEDSDSNDAFEEGDKSPFDSAAAARDGVASPLISQRMRRCWRGTEEVDKSSPSEQLSLKTSKLTAATPKKPVSVYSVDSPQSEPSCSSQLGNEVEMKAGESVCSFSSPMDPDVHLVQECSLVPSASSRPVYFSGGTLIESQSPSSRAELDLSVDPAWSKQSKAQIGFASFHQNEHMDADAFGLKLISVSGSTSTDCQLSEGSSSTFEYEDGGDMMNFGLYRDQSGRSQLCNGQPGGGARGKRFICSICSKTYATSQNLDVHMRIHTGQRPFSCDQCGKKFTQSAHLKSHLSVHSGERPYGCTLCSRSFIVKYSLKLHMKKCHPNV
uniref:C2H2-type domain-containing protein n=1 Tax=Amphiprion percula TaxID=161767 RepID=A0A3P8RYZ1_AMPPE